MENLTTTISPPYAEQLTQGLVPGLNYFNVHTHPQPEGFQVYLGDRNMSDVAFEAKIGLKGWVRSYEYETSYDEEGKPSTRLMSGWPERKEPRIFEEHGNVTLRPKGE